MGDIGGNHDSTSTKIMNGVRANEQRIAITASAFHRLMPISICHGTATDIVNAKKPPACNVSERVQIIEGKTKFKNSGILANPNTEKLNNNKMISERYI